MTKPRKPDPESTEEAVAEETLADLDASEPDEVRGGAATCSATLSRPCGDS